MKDINGENIMVGDILESEWGYRVVVEEAENKELVGKLICDKNHPCANIPYSLNNGNGHMKITSKN